VTVNKGEGTGSGGGPVIIDPMIGRVLDDRFEIKKFMTRGGMGRIYLAEQRPLGRAVVVKILDVKSERTEEFRRRFFLEASLCARLSHPNIIRVFDYGCDDGVYFIAMEHLKGRTLHEVIRNDAPLDTLRIISLMKQVCSALEEAHNNGIIHRDLKPANLFITEQGVHGEFIKLMDFGLVKDLELQADVTRTGHALGSPLYMAPEQITGDPVDPRTDVYALGVILFIMFTGRRPYKKGSPMQVMMSQLHEPPPAFSEVNKEISVSQNLERLTRAAMRKGKNERLVSTMELLRGLRACELEIKGELPIPLDLVVDHGLVRVPAEIDAVLSETGWTGSSGALLAEGRHFPEMPSAATFYSSGGETETRKTPKRWLWPLVAFCAMLMGVLLVMITVVTMVVVGGPLAGAPAGQIAPVVATVQVNSEPAGAEVEHDGVFLGKTPLEVKLPEGATWELDLRLPGYESRRVRVTWETGTLMVPLPPGNPG
jgi:serine/threonine-protein kinase